MTIGGTKELLKYRSLLLVHCKKLCSKVQAESINYSKSSSSSKSIELKTEHNNIMEQFSHKRPLEEAVSPACKVRVLDTLNEHSQSNSLLTDSSETSVVNIANDSCLPNEDNAPSNTNSNSSTSADKPQDIYNVSNLSPEERLKKKYERWDKEKTCQMQQTKICDKNLEKMMANYSEEEAFLASDQTTLKGGALLANKNTVPLDIQPQPDLAGVEKEDGLILEKKKRRMYAMLMSYSGKDYLGMQV